MNIYIYVVTKAILAVIATIQVLLHVCVYHHVKCHI